MSTKYRDHEMIVRVSSRTVGEMNEERYATVIFDMQSNNASVLWNDAEDVEEYSHDEALGLIHEMLGFQL